ncbi:MAG: mechanosensitive ion channel family protein [Desulfovibrio sp.]|uniref:mechanosensitive ion channel family protein n=1 Tax=Desulfovibrio sp. TaxID=885 RepID=UPI001A679FAC|nr:mechanosensitive ion channel family protein [Desulfovibrio sp.]MBD5416791.1 mechanosensitive ion channel family protein [Desulfovibrio sp.]
MNPETWKILLEYFDYRQFLHQNPPLRLACIFGIVCLALGAVRVLWPWVQRKFEAFMERKYEQASGSGGKSGEAPVEPMDFSMYERVMLHLKRLFYVGIISWGARMLVLAPVYANALATIFNIVCTVIAIALVAAIVPFNLDIYMRRHGETLKTSQSRSLMPIVTGLIWAMGLTFLLDNLGFRVSSIVAGLGIMGVAVGLAGKAILEDFFSYIVILLDKPFRIGDHVELKSGKAGDVEYMGPKTTHLRSLEGDLIVCANSEMTTNTIVNLGSVSERPVVLELGVAFEMPLDVVKRVPDMLREAVEAFPTCSFDRACMLSFGSANYMFQLIYVVHEPDIRSFQMTRSDVNLAIQQKLNDEHVLGAYPTTHMFMTDQPGGLLGPTPPAPQTTTPVAAAKAEQAAQAGAKAAPGSGSAS